jgi:hypothetical protein
LKTQAILQHRSKKGQSLSAAPHTLARERLARLWTFALLRVVDGIRVIFDESRASVTRPVPCAKPIEKRRIPLSVKLDTFTMSAQCRLVLLYGRPTNGMW